MIVHDRMYFGSKISENLTRTPENYLVCHNVPIARTGTQEYLASEIGLSGDNIIIAVRDESEVFTKETLASFESKPLCLLHPNDSVTVDNISRLMKGVIQNVHRGTNENSDKIIADIIVYDKSTIEKILDGQMREVSCGYDCQYIPNNDGTYSQTKIRGNHVSIVDEGRAGPEVAIKDSKAVDNKDIKVKGGNKMAKKNDSFLGKLFGYVTVKDEASLSEVIELVEEFKEKTGEVATIEPTVVDQESSGEEDKFDALVKMVEALAAKVEALSPASTDEDGSTELDAALEEEKINTDSEVVEDTSEEVTDSEEVVDADETEEETSTADKAIIKKLAKDMRPLIAKLSVEDRKAFNSMLTNSIKEPTKVDGYKNIQKAKDSAIQSRVSNPTDLGKMIAQQFNPHYKKEVK